MRIIFLSAVLVGLGTLWCATDAVAEPSKDRDAQPIRPPVPSYPPEAAARGVQGVCDVQFNVNEAGYPFNIMASCSSPLFCSESERAISRVQFAPKLVDGEAVPRINVVYPLEFRMQSWSEEAQDYVGPPFDSEAAITEPCDAIAVS